MPTIGLITEGPTDLQVLRLFLTGLCGSSVVITELLPVAQADGTYPPTGWTKVFNYVGDAEFADALNNTDFPVDFVVVHLDSDSCEHFVPPISHTTWQNEEIIRQILERLIQQMELVTPHFYAENAHRILFAIAIRSTECWLLPLFFNDNTKAKIENCVNSLNVKLRPRNIFIDASHKQIGYRKLLQTDELKPRKVKRAVVLDISRHNVGFADFVEQVEIIINGPAAVASAENPEA